MVPRKLRDPINPLKSGSCGWGLYFVEEEYCKGWYKGVVLVGTSVFAYFGGVVVALMVAMAFGSTAPGTEGFEEYRLIFAVYCFLFAFFHLEETRHSDRERST